MRTEIVTRDEMPPEMLRKQHRAELAKEYSELRQQARDLVEEIQQDTPDETVRRIERKHDKLVARIDALRAEILQTDFAEQERQPQTNSNIAGVDLPSDAHPTARAIADAMYGRMTGKAPEGAGREWMGRSLCEMGRVLIEIRGERPAPTRNGLLDQMLTHRAGLHPTSDFPNLLQSSANRVLLSAFEAAQSPLRALARERMVADFRSITMLRLSEAPKLEKVNEHGEIKRGTRAESKEAYKVSTFAKIFGLTREAIINDDLSAFSDSATAFGQAAAQTEADEIVALFTDNSGNGVTLDDGDQLYTTGRGNKAGSGAAPDVTTLGAARKALRDMKGLDGVTPLNIVPRYLVTGSALETAVEQLLTTTLYATEVDNANPFAQGKIIRLVEPRFTGNAWRLSQTLRACRHSLAPISTACAARNSRCAKGGTCSAWNIAASWILVAASRPAAGAGHISTLAPNRFFGPGTS